MTIISIADRFKALERRISYLESVLGEFVGSEVERPPKESPPQPKKEAQKHRSRRSPAEGEIVRQRIIALLRARKAPVKLAKIRDACRLHGGSIASWYMKDLQRKGLVQKKGSEGWALSHADEQKPARPSEGTTDRILSFLRAKKTAVTMAQLLAETKMSKARAYDVLAALRKDGLVVSPDKGLHMATVKLPVEEIPAAVTQLNTKFKGVA